jgi:hypothetical protein
LRTYAEFKYTLAREVTNLDNLKLNLESFNQDLPEAEQVAVNQLNETFAKLDT